MRSFASAAAFIHGLTMPDVPDSVRRRVGVLLEDFVAVSLAGRATPTARIAADYAVRQHAGDDATLLADGRRAAATGAAWANGVLANALDYDDGHRLVKGHPGAVVIPSALAVGETVQASPEDLLAAVLVGYEIAIRAGLHLHATRTTYHASGAWGAVGAAAAAARLLRLDAGQTRHALGLAAYHAPIAPIMSSVADPAMTKDALGWGAMTGTSAALLAAGGFTAVASDLVDAIDQGAADHETTDHRTVGQWSVSQGSAGPSGDLGFETRWHVEDLYVKSYPCCRWAHPAIAAALALRTRDGLHADQVAHVTVRTFAAATALARRPPTTTEEAQYNLAWPVAAALATGQFGVEHVLPPAFADPATRRLMERVTVEVDPDHEAAFPAVRRADVAITTTDGGRHQSGPTESPGEPGDPRWEDIVADKLARFGTQPPPPLDALLKAAAAKPPTEAPTAASSPE